MKIVYDESNCVRCGGCVTESEDGGVRWQDGKIIFDVDRKEDWSLIASICPVGAIEIKVAE